VFALAGISFVAAYIAVLFVNQEDNFYVEEKELDP